ncbi:MAG: glycosyltransferase family 4 protein [Deltaproteobacteria bacterium]|nr:glycosyltransferase family 4 protein [Deltaproteobacteria bacterium]
MKALFLIQGWNVAASRYRVLQYLPYLERNGVQTKVTTYPQDIGGYAKLYREVGDYDVVFLQRKRFNPPFLQVLRWRAKGIVYDFDDAVMYKDSTAPSPYSRTRQRRFARTVRDSDHVIAGNNFLRDQVARFTDRVTVIPTAIDRDRYLVKDYTIRKEQVTIGWIGDHGSIHYLIRLRPVFEELGKKYHHLELKIICDTFFDCENIHVIKKGWSQEEEVEDLRGLDIGVMPLLDDPWSWGKCGFKILQYYGVGIPVVCTPVGVNRDVVQEGVNGFWAMTHEEWVEKLSILLEDPVLCQKMGMRGRELVRESFSVQGCAPKFYQVLEEVAQRGTG